jgi:two-component system sensor histidine kinase QseC
VTPKSIRGRLAIPVRASIALVWTIALGSSYRHATREVAEWDDARLVQLAQFNVLLDQNDHRAHRDRGTQMSGAA